jgi:hypothetical protein
MSVAIIEQCMVENRWQTVKELIDHTGVSGSIVLRIFMTGVKCARLLPVERHII